MTWTKALHLKVPVKAHWAVNRDGPLVAFVAVFCFFAGKLGLFLVSQSSLVPPVWPLAGVALGAVLICGYRVWPGILAGALLSSLPAFVGPRHHPLVAAAVSICMASGETLQALVAAWLVETYANGRDACRQPRTLAIFVAVAALAGSSISATSNALSSFLGGLIPGRELGDAWAAFWLANAVGVLLIAPLLLLWSQGPLPKPRLARIAEAAAIVTSLVIASGIAFGGWHTGSFRTVAVSCLIVPVLLWTAFRFGERGASAVVFLLGGFAIAGNLRGQGPFVVPDRQASFLLLQNFIAAITFMSLLLGAEVSQRRRIDAGLRASEQRYRDLFDHTPQPMWLFDYESLRFLAVNEAAVRHYGYARHELLAMTIADIQPTDDAAALTELVKQARRGLPVPVQHRHRKKNGEVIDVEVSRHNLIVDGREAAMILVTDVTERKQAQERAAAFSELGRRLSTARTPREATRIIVDTADALFGWSACRLELGPTPSGLMETIYCVETSYGQRTELMPAPSAPSAITKRALEEGAQLAASAAIPSTTAAVHTSGTSTMAVPVRQEQRVLGVLSLKCCAMRPYTADNLGALQALADHCGGALERIRAETALRESDQRLRLALAASRMGIWTMELQGQRRVISSPELDAIFGLKPGEFDGTEEGLFALIQPEDHALVRGAIAQAIQTEGDYEIEFRILPRDRPLGWLLARGRACFDTSGEPARLLGVAFDISARKTGEQEILRLNLDLERRVAERTIQLETINKELESFSYSVSHDLRAPLRSIRGFSEVLLDRYADKLDERGREFLKRACESSHHMDLLIEDLIKLSRIGRAELHQQRVDLSFLADSIAADLRAAGPPRRSVKILIAPGLQACGDERLLRIMLENLLRNAWKFTAHQPKAKIEFGRLPAPEGAFFIRDNGAGFDMANASRLFGVFQRLHSASEFPGTGIGLATVQRILNRHGGHAWAESAVGQGATFYFTLPQAHPSQTGTAQSLVPASGVPVREHAAA